MSVYTHWTGALNSAIHKPSGSACANNRVNKLCSLYHHPKLTPSWGDFTVYSFSCAFLSGLNTCNWREPMSASSLTLLYSMVLRCVQTDCVASGLPRVDFSTRHHVAKKLELMFNFCWASSGKVPRLATCNMSLVLKEHGLKCASVVRPVNYSKDRKLLWWWK